MDTHPSNHNFTSVQFNFMEVCGKILSRVSTRNPFFPNVVIYKFSRIKLKILYEDPFKYSDEAGQRK